LANIFIPVAAGGRVGEHFNFAEIKPSALSGFVYLDANDNGIRESNELQIKNVTVTLTGTNDLGQAVSLTTRTGQVPGQGIGFSHFTNLRPGTYSIVETQPAGLTDGKDTIGTQGGTTSNDRFNITLPGCTTGTNNNFGEKIGPPLEEILVNIS